MGMAELCLLTDVQESHQQLEADLYFYKGSTSPALHYALNRTQIPVAVRHYIIKSYKTIIKPVFYLSYF
jgi:hypothetical protein